MVDDGEKSKVAGSRDTAPAVIHSTTERREARFPDVSTPDYGEKAAARVSAVGARDAAQEVGGAVLQYTAPAAVMPPVTRLHATGVAAQFEIHDGVRPQPTSAPGDEDGDRASSPAAFQTTFEATFKAAAWSHGGTPPTGVPPTPLDLPDRSDISDTSDTRKISDMPPTEAATKPQSSGARRAENQGMPAAAIAASGVPLRAPAGGGPGQGGRSRIAWGRVPWAGGRGGGSNTGNDGGGGRGGFPLWGKVLLGLFSFGLLAFLAAAIAVFLYFQDLREGLPGTDALSSYEPKVTTRVHANNGELVGEFARERRLFVPVATIPDHVKQSFISAEDKSFYTHGGVDFKGVVRATINNIRFRLQKSNQLHGASTITQQVAKNFLLSSERTYRRKFREWLIAWEMEKVLSKDDILELYLNEINLGNRSYGVAAAALNYFDKSLPELTIAESAYLAALPKAPNNYHPVRNHDKAIIRRNWIIGRLLEDGYITDDVAKAERATPLGAMVSPPLGARNPDTEYFVEAVRRQVVDIFGGDALYDGGLSIRTTLDPRLQAAAQRAFRKWLAVYDQRHGWRGALDNIDLPKDLNEVIAADGQKPEEKVFVWQQRLKTARRDLIKARKYAEDLAPWELAIVLEPAGVKAKIGFADGRVGYIPVDEAGWARRYINVNTVGAEVKDLRKLLDRGDVLLVEAVEEAEEIRGDGTDLYALRQVPGVNGGLLVMDPHTGQVRAMVGGFSFGLSEFNRAIQAKRQPGSTFKPFVYTAALDNGYTPSSIVLDAPFVAPSLGDEWWRPGNYIAGRFYGESTLRLGIEKSRNTMTARLAQDIGIGLIIDYAERFGVSDTLPRELAISLGAGETTLMRLTSAYSIFVNGGKRVTPVFIDRVQDRYGETVFRRDERPCVGCQVTAWDNQREPRLPDAREQVVDPRTAYQMVSILEGAIKRGTGLRVKEHIKTKPLAGKTGTTDDYRDAWFVGFSPDLAAGVYVGFDLPASMGQGEGGGIVAAPVFGEFMKEALAEETATPFRAPSGIRQVRVNAKTGRPARLGERNVILEAFKAGDDLYGGSNFAINGEDPDIGATDEAIDDTLGGLY